MWSILYGMKTIKPPSAGLEIVPSPKRVRSTTRSRSSQQEDSSAKPPLKPIAEVYHQFRIDPLEVSAAPEITSILMRSLGGANGQLPMARIFNLLGASDSKAIQRFLVMCDDISSKRDYDRLSIEALCVYAGVSPIKVLNTIARVAKSVKSNEETLRDLMADGEGEPDRDDAAWDHAFPKISDRLEQWSEDRRLLFEANQ